MKNFNFKIGFIITFYFELDAIIFIFLQSLYSLRIIFQEYMGLLYSFAYHIYIHASESVVYNSKTLKKFNSKFKE